MQVETLIDLHNFNCSHSDKNLKLTAQQIGLFRYLQLVVGTMKIFCI